MDHELIAVGVLDQNHGADGTVVFFHEELDLFVLQFFECRIKIAVELQCHRAARFAGLEMRSSLADGQRIRAYLVLDKGRIFPSQTLVGFKPKTPS